MGIFQDRALSHVPRSIGRKLVSGFALVSASLGLAAQAGAADVVTHWVMPVIQPPETARPQQPKIFGTIPLPLNARTTSTRWAKLMNASLAQPALAHLADNARSLPRQDQVAYIQSAVNRAVRSPATSVNCSDDGYWAPANETLVRGLGDCFDIAIAKMEALRLLGVPDKDLYLTTGRVHPAYGTGKGRETVALLVRVGDSFSVLPEQSDKVIQSTDTPDGAGFAPVITYGVGMTWIHGRLVKLAAATTAPASPAIAAMR